MAIRAEDVIHQIVMYVAKAYSTGTAQTRNEAEIHQLIKRDVYSLSGMLFNFSIFDEFAKQIFNLPNTANKPQIILAISVAIQDGGEIQKRYNRLVSEADPSLSSVLPEVNASVYSILESLHTRINELERKILK